MNGPRRVSKTVPQPEAERESSAPPTLTRILDATIDALAWSGMEHLSMAEVSRAAKISRQTLYRYFPNKDQLLIGVMQHLQSVVSSRLSKRIAEDASLEGRLHTISAYDIDERSGRPGIALLNAEPAFMIRFLNAHATDICPVLELALQPFFDEAEKGKNISIDRKLFVEAIMRIRLSIFVVPGNTSAEFAIRAVRAMVLGLLADPTPWNMATRSKHPARRP
jgi:AcrR family transcriptional regulator